MDREMWGPTREDGVMRIRRIVWINEEVEPSWVETGGRSILKKIFEGTEWLHGGRERDAGLFY
jgi:hypothetical protein